MVQPVTIFKYHGTGNDFVVVDADAFNLDPEELAPYICDRHRGVGADGLIVVDRAVDRFDARMTIYNRDGSRPQMCGNGIRCVARHLVERHGFPTSLRIGTDAGERVCETSTAPWEVDVDMGVPKLGAPVIWGGRTFQPVDMGNPHAVVFETAPAIAVVDDVGEALNSDGSPFPEGVNVEFTTVHGGERVDVVVYERGVGRTQACGTGACAAAAAAWHGSHAEGEPLEVRLPGGPLSIRRVGDHVWMRGDAEFVMEATLGAGWLEARTN